MTRSSLLRGIAAAALVAACPLAGGHALANGAPHGVFAFIALNGSPSPAIYRNASVVGVTLQATWAALEPSPGQFVWAALDAKIATAAEAGRVVALDVTPGVGSPAWVYAQGAAKFTYQWTLPWGFTPCSMVSYPLPWDPIYGAAWKGFVAAFARHYAGNPAVVMVKVTGINGPTSELLLPYSTLGHAPPFGTVCGNTPVAPVSAWKTAGYLPGKVTAAWNGFVGAFAAGFPTQQLVVQTGGWGFPPIDANGNVIAGSEGDYALPKALLLAASQTIGARYGVENDGLQSGYNWTPPATLPADTLLGYETGAPVTGDPTCRANGFVAPCDPVTVMQQAIARANAASAAFLELFPPDVTNPALAETIAGFGG